MCNSKSYVQMRKEFQNLYFTKISPWLSNCDNDRKKKLKVAIVKSFFSLIIAIILTYFSVKIHGEDVFKLALVFYGMVYGFYYIDKKSYESNIKKSLMPKVCKCFGDLKWRESIIDTEDVDKYLRLKSDALNFCKKSYLISDFDDYFTDDIFSGSYLDVPYEIIEANFDKGSGGSGTQIFNGVILKIKMNKNFRGHTVIRPDTVMHKSPSAILRHTELEDVNFEKKFDVYTDDEVEARYLITPSFMQRLNCIKLAFGASNVSCSFYRSYLLIALSTKKDLFSLCSLLKPLNDDKQFFTMFEELLSLVKLIDHFKLNQNIGL